MAIRQASHAICDATHDALLAVNVSHKLLVKISPTSAVNTRQLKVTWFNDCPRCWLSSTGQESKAVGVIPDAAHLIGIEFATVCGD